MTVDRSQAERWLTAAMYAALGVPLLSSGLGTLADAGPYEQLAAAALALASAIVTAVAYVAAGRGPTGRRRMPLALGLAPIVGAVVLVAAGVAAGEPYAAAGKLTLAACLAALSAAVLTEIVKAKGPARGTPHPD